MIVDLPKTTTSQISKALVKIREEGGAVALGRVLTLVIATRHGEEEEAIAAANAASREHPMRIIVVSTEAPELREQDEARLDAEIRVGGDAGASEVIVLRAYGATAAEEEGLVTGLLLPDAPVVTWWPHEAPEVVSESPLGRIAQRRITDAAACNDPMRELRRRHESHRPGDTDFAWTRLTLWRAQLAAVLDQPPFEPVNDALVHGAADSPSTALLAAWLQLQLEVPVTLLVSSPSRGATGIHGVTLTRPGGDIELKRELPSIATLVQPNQPVHDISLPRRGLSECLTEELRRLDPDELFARVIGDGFGQLADAVREGAVVRETKSEARPK